MNYFYLHAIQDEAEKRPLIAEFGNSGLIQKYYDRFSGRGLCVREPDKEEPPGPYITGASVAVMLLSGSQTHV